jgi:hypothetical protein
LVRMFIWSPREDKPRGFYRRFWRTHDEGSSSNTLACFRSSVSNPSGNQP